MAGAGVRLVRRGGTKARRTVVVTVGGPERTRVVIVMACVLALASADTATVGAAAIELRRALRISNTDIGVLVSVTSLVAAVFSLPFGVLADRVRRTWLLAIALLVWGVAMLWSATTSSFGELLVTRLFLGAITAVAGPVIASLTGDWFSAAERGRIYGYILTGELLGAGAGFAFTGDIAALSWRASFVILALPAFALAWFVLRLPEPARGGTGALVAEPGTGPPPDEPAVSGQMSMQGPATPGQAGPPGPATGAGPSGMPPPGRPGHAAGAGPTGMPGQAAGPGQKTAPQGAPEPEQPQDIAARQGIRPDKKLVAQAVAPMTFLGTIRYIMSVRTNIALVISGAFAYYFLSGIQTFGTEFVSGQYHVGQVLANLLLLVVGVGAVIGVVASGPISDALLRRGHLSARVTVAAIAASATVLLFIPALITHSVLGALPYVFFAAAALTAQNPPIDAARLDIMPPWMWGRAEGLRTLLRTAAQSLAPVLFGVVADDVFSGGTAGLKWAFVVMLLPLAVSALYLFRARRLYPVDVATAAAATTRRAARQGRGPRPRPGSAARPAGRRGRPGNPGPVQAR
jgi:MFS family permease